jgi:hypothetical protein
MFLAGEGAGVVNKEGAATKEPGEGDGQDQKSGGSCNIKNKDINYHKPLFQKDSM